MPPSVTAIIPVYNAAAYVRDAVESALAQPECAEIVLVEDGSVDGSLAVCQRLADENDRVRLYQHPGGANRGAGATRNLALSKAGYDRVAFLDADDWWLPGHLALACAILDENQDIDGVYGAIDGYYEDDMTRQRLQDRGYTHYDRTTMTQRIAPEDLFEALIWQYARYFSLDSLVVRRSAVERTGPFDEHLRLHQDTVWMTKLAACARLVPGKLDEPVAMRRLHADNRITAARPDREIWLNKVRAAETLLRWGRDHLDAQRQRTVLNFSVLTAMRLYGSRTRHEVSGVGSLFARRQLLEFGWRNPSLVVTKAFWGHLLRGSRTEAP